MTPEEVNDAVHGRTRWVQFGKPIPYRLTSKEMAEFETAKRRGWVECRSWKRPNLENAWWIWCEANNQPYVRVRRGRTYSNVSADLYCIESNMRESAWADLEECLSKYPVRGAACSAGRTLAWRDKILNEHAGEIAAALWEYLTRPESLVSMRP